MASQGPLFPASTASLYVGGTHWTNTTNITASNDAYASVTLSASSSNRLVGWVYPFNIPANAIVTGVAIEVEYSVASGTSSASLSVGLIYNGSGADIETIYPAWTTTDKKQQFGGPNSMWGLSSMSPNIVNNHGGIFGPSIQVISGTGTFQIDAATMTVYYYLPPSVEEGVNLPGTAGTDSSIGTLGWSSPDYIKTDDTNAAFCYTASSDTNIEDYSIVLTGTGVDGAEDKAVTGSSYTNDDFYKRYTYGGTDDRWSEWLTPAIVNDSSFGIKIAVKFTPSNAISYYLTATNFGLAVPDGAVIRGIEFTVNRYIGFSGAVTTYNLRYVKVSVYYTLQTTNYTTLTTPGTGGDLASIGTVSWLYYYRLEGGYDGNHSYHYIATGEADIVEHSVKLLNAGAASGDDRSTGSSYIDGSGGSGSIYELVQYGGYGDLWGIALTPAIVNASNFGAGVACRFVTSGTITHYLTGTNFGFSIPTDATIVGVEVETKRYAAYNVSSVYDIAYHDSIKIKVWYQNAGIYTNTGVAFPSKVESDSSYGTVAWTDPGSITVDDGTFAYIAHDGSDTSVVETVISLVIGGSVSGANRSTGAAYYEGSTLDTEVVQYGDEEDLWDSDLTPAIINSADFGVVLACSFPTSAVQSEYLKATNFGFNIPTDANISGVIVETERVVQFQYIGTIDVVAHDYVSITVYYYYPVPEEEEAAAGPRRIRAQTRICKRVSEPNQVDWQDPINKDHPLNNNLLGWWLVGNENPHFGGNKFLSLTKQHHGSFVNMDPVTDWLRNDKPQNSFGSILSDGNSSNYISVDPIYEMNGDTKMSLSVWVYRIASDEACIGRGSNNSSNGYVSFGFQWWIDNKIYLQVENGSASYPWVLATHNNVWVWLCMTYNAARTGNDRIRLYINGVLQSLTTGGASPSATIANGQASFPLVFGRTNTDTYGNTYSNTKFNDIRLYKNRTLSDAEVVKLYKETLAGNPTTLNRRVKTLVNLPATVYPDVYPGFAVKSRPTIEIDWENPVNKDHHLNRGRVSWWLAGPSGTGGNKIRDLINRNHATLSNMAISTTSSWKSAQGRSGGIGSISFDGTNDYMIVSDNDNLDVTKLTVSLWFKRRGNTTYTHFMCKGGAATWTAPYAIWCVRLYGTSIQSWINDGADTANYVNGVTTISNNRWYHIAITYDGTTLTLYLDGKYQNSKVRSVTLSTSIYNVYFGSTTGLGASEFLNGYMDDMTIYNRALSASEMYSLYNEARQGYPNTLNYKAKTLCSVPSPIPTTAKVSIAVPRNEVDWNNPVIKENPLLRGITHWWLAGSESPYWGGNKLRNLVSSNHATLYTNTKWGRKRTENIGSMNCTRSPNTFAYSASNVNFSGSSKATIIVAGLVRSFYTAGFPYISDCMEVQQGATGYFGLRFNHDAAVGHAAWHCAVVRTTAGVDVTANSGVAHTANTRFWMAATYDTGSLKLYVNGLLAGSNTTSGTLNTNSPMYIGASPDWGPSGGYRALDGLIETSIIYTGRALNAAEIYRWYQEYKNDYATTLRRKTKTLYFDSQYKVTYPAIAHKKIDTQQVDWEQPLNIDTPLNRGLTGFWIVGQDAKRGGNKWFDIKGRNTGELKNGATWAANERNNFGAISLDGTDDYINLYHPSTFNFGTGDYTFAFNIFPRALNTTYQVIIGKDSDAGSGRQLIIGINADGGYGSPVAGSIDHVILNSGGTYTGYWTNASVLTQDKWNFVITGRSGNSLFLNVNGVDKAITNAINFSTGWPITMNSNSIDLWVGRRVYSGYNNPFNGAINSLHVYNRALSSVERTALYKDAKAEYKTILNHMIKRYAFKYVVPEAITIYPTIHRLGPNIGYDYAWIIK